MTTPPMDPIRVVLADDDGALRAVLARRLELEGFAVSQAADGSEAVAMVRTRRPDLLVLDLWMPGLDGLQVLDALRGEPAAARLMVVMLSGDDEADARLEALGGGADAFLIKGGSLDELIAEVRSRAALAVGPPFGDADEPDADDDLAA